MAYYKLASQNRSDSTVDEVIFRSEDGEKKTVSALTASELSDSDVSVLRDMGFEVVESSSPDQERPPTGADVIGMSPVVTSSGGQPAISQTGMQSLQQIDVDQPQSDEHDENPS